MMRFFYFKKVFARLSSFGFTMEKNVGVIFVGKQLNSAKLIAELYHHLCDGITLINSSFTLQLVPLINYFILTSIFVGYTALRELIVPSTLVQFQVIYNGSWLIVQGAIKIFIAHAGTATTNEARETPVIVTKIINQGHLNQNDQDVYKEFLPQVQYRNLNLENAIFKVNYHLPLAVTSYRIFFNSIKLKRFFIPQIFSTIVTYLVITCQFDSSGSLN